jgi:succinate dehydrogenase subunit C
VKPKPDQGGPYPAYSRTYPRWWWLRRGPYLRFAAREITSMFAAGFSVLLLAFLFALGSGQAAYQSFLDLLNSPWMVAASGLILVALLYHVATWFRLTTYIVVIRVGRFVLPRSAVIGALVIAWLGASAIVAYFHIWF